MALNKNKFKNDISKNLKASMKKAFYEAFSIKSSVSDFISGSSSSIETLKKKQAEKFAEVIDNEFSEFLANTIDQYIKSADVDIDFDSLYKISGAPVVAQDGGASLLVNLKINGKLESEKTTNGKLK